MQKHRQMTTLILFILLLQIENVVYSYSLSKQSTFSNCPYVENEEIVISTKEFSIPPNPFIPSKSYSLVENSWILLLRIDRKRFIPKNIFALKHLEYLIIQKTCFEPCSRPEIPEEIQCFASSLLELSIENTPITSLPNQIGQLKKLQTLKLIRTGLVSLPDIIGDLSSLETLDLSYNHLRLLPKTIQKLKSLKYLTLTNNPYLHSIQPINGLSSLLTLDVRHCQINMMPENLTQLWFLQMRNNTLKDLRHIRTIGSQSNRSKEFYFNDNEIRIIHPQIFQIKNLTKLHLANNHITNLPLNDLNNQTKLELYIEKNCFDKRSLQKLNQTLLMKNPKSRLHCGDQKTCAK